MLFVSTMPLTDAQKRQFEAISPELEVCYKHASELTEEFTKGIVLLSLLRQGHTVPVSANT